MRASHSRVLHDGKTLSERETIVNRKGWIVRFLEGGLMVGLIGVGMALLFAPQSGKRTRTQIQETGKQVKEQVEDAYLALCTQVDARIVELQDSLDALSSKVEELIGEGKRYLLPEESLYLSDETQITPRSFPLHSQVVTRVGG
jgi:gas vesicle protein